MKLSIKIYIVFAAAVVAVMAISVVHAKVLERKTDITDYRAVASDISEKMRAHHYNPTELNSAAYRRTEEKVAALANQVESDQAFIEGFRAIWKEGPFSHVELNPADTSADELAEYLDNLRIGGGGAILSWHDSDAVLTVNTMMGQDTIEELQAAYQEINENNAGRLIIDLRENGGGAFAIRPLVGHLIDTAFDAGSFVSQKWNAAHLRPPTKAELSSAPPWQGWSIRAFWEDVQEQPFIKVSFEPIEPIFNGPVYVLTSQRTASAAELATDALKSVGRATIVGEKTAGQMLSQKIYDVLGGFHLSLPIADYYSIKNGRIEGAGIVPDIAVDPNNALNVALQQD